MRETTLLGKGAALAAVVLLVGCPSDDGSDDTSAVTMTTAMTMTTMTTADTETGTTDPMTTAAESSTGSMVECPDDTISFAADIQPIFDASCVTDCHTMGGNWPTLLLEDAYDTIVDEDSLETMTAMDDELALIVPNDVPHSYIVHKLRGTHTDVVDPAIAQLRMPSMIVMCDPMEEGCGMDGTMIVEGDPLPEAQIQLIEDWINCGAPE